MQTLMLLHGAPGDGSLWGPVLDELGPDIGAITPTLRRFGPDPWGDDGSSFGTEAHTEQLIGIIERQAERPIAVAAWSYSTHVLLNLMLRRPGLVGRAFLYEPGLDTYLTSRDEKEAFEEDARRAFGPVARELRESGPDDAVEALFESSGGAGFFRALPRERRERYLVSSRIIPLLMGGGRPPARITADELADVAVPLMVAFGSSTRPLFEIASRAVSRAVPSARLRVVEGADHMLPEKDPARFASLLADWISP